MDLPNSAYENASVYELLTKLCEKTAQKYCRQCRNSPKNLAVKMRSRSYEIILKRTTSELPLTGGDPVVDLLSCHFVQLQSAKNVVEYKRCIELKNVISELRNRGENKEYVYSVVRLLVKLHNTVLDDVSQEIYQKPFSFGLLQEMLPKPKRESFGSQPYPYYPSYIFELPYKLKSVVNNLNSKQSYMEYTVKSFDSKSLIPDSISQQAVEIKTFLSPLSLSSMTSSQVSPYSDSNIFNLPRLTTPRDLLIPKSTSVEPKVSFVSTEAKLESKESPGVEVDEINIWEIASQVDKDVPGDIWDFVSKLPPVHERQLIATSSREITLWRENYGGMMSDLSIISEKQFIRHIMYLIVGIETKSFPYKHDTKYFYIKENLVLECISKEHLQGYIAPLLITGTYYRRLYDFAFNQSADDHFHDKGLVFEAAREIVRRYLLEFRLKATDIFEDFWNNKSEDLNCMPTLLQILYHMEPLIYEIETIASIYKFNNSGTSDAKSTIPHGAELMSYLFNEISLITHKTTALVLYNSLVTVCRVYFKFIEKFIFEGELDDRFNEFFIRKDNQYVNSRTKRYWDKGFHITLSVAVPDFLRPLASFILLCGKSLRLLKLCNPSDPLVLLISSDHPSVRCCASFEDLEREQQILDVYRTRCLFVSGEPVTFDQILLKREAERKAFTEMASLKQAETMEKIVAERKRLAQLIIAEKQHSLRVLEAAMAEAKAAKNKVKQREKQRFKLEDAAEKVTDEVDSKLRDVEKNKMLEYYSKLNMEVEKSKIHTEWKIKRLQLDQTRMQLLSTEERNFKREKLELEHQRNEEMMAMSIQSDFKSEDDDGDDEGNNNEVSKNDPNIEDSTLDTEVIEPQQSQHSRNRNKAQTSSDVFSAICNVARSIFGVGKNEPHCDNELELDSQGNVIRESENNHTRQETSSDVIGSKLDEANDNLRFLEAREEALKNKQKVMCHEFGKTDHENNEIKYPIIRLTTVDEENNIQETPFTEARRNKMKVLGAEFNMVKQEEKEIVQELKTEAHREALINRQKVLGVEYNLPPDKVRNREPANVAQEEAVRNKNKVLGSDYDGRFETRFDSTKKAGLRLNLKPFNEPSLNTNTSSNTGAVTPGELFPRLDLETPTTAEMPVDGPMTSDVFTPKSECSKDLDTGRIKLDKEYLTSEGFNFSIIVDDEAAVSDVISDTQINPEDSPTKSLDTDIIKSFKRKTSVFNVLDGSYSLESFDPFGIKDWDRRSKNYFSSQIDLDMTSSPYMHPAFIMEEVRKKPYSNIYNSRYSEEGVTKIDCDNIATLTACLQRSVMLPLTYQLEVVNNSILTYFLVNLDMYEHLRSLKDYFFLMDGEFSRSICHNLFKKLTKTVNPQELLNFSTLHNILDKALGSSISHVHKFSENLSFSIAESPLSFQHSSPDVLQCLSLTYSVSWPLNIILSQEALLRYAKVFQFLIKMRRVFWVLSEDFESLKLSVKLSREHSRKLLRSPQYISIQLYRHIMASLIRALDNYIVTTCILTSWTEFEKDLKKARTLDDLYECHVVYIKNVLFRCLLNNRSTPVMKLLNDIFTVILKFSRVLKAGEWQQKEANGYFTHSSYPQLEELYHLYEKVAKYLHKVITKLMECGYQRHLVELLTMVNLNGYYDPERTHDPNVSIG